ncbi:MAG: DUF4035 domain-containing protein [Bermanella sp.]
MRLATQLGEVNIDSMLASLTGLQMLEWEYFYQVEPFGAEVEELRFGNICATLANINRDSKTKLFNPADFFVTYLKSKPESQSVDDLMAAIEGAFNGR